MTNFLNRARLSRTPLAGADPRDGLARCCSALALTMIATQVLGRLGEALLPAAFLPATGTLLTASACAAVALAALRLPDVQRLTQVFAFIALFCAALLLITTPGAAPVLRQALYQGTAFGAFLTALGLVRAPVRRSPLVARAAARLFAFPARRQGAAVLYGTQVLAVLFNLGTIGMMSDIARRQADTRDTGETPIDPDGLTLAAQRGAILATLWNPIGVGFAIVTSAIPGLEPGRFLLLSLACTTLLTGGVLLALPARRPAAGAGTAPPHGVIPNGAPGAEDRALEILVVAVLALIAATLLLHWLLSVSFIVAGCMVLPALALAWSRLDPAVRSEPGTRPSRALAEASAGMANEATIFLCATVIAAAVSLWLTRLGLGGLQATAVPPLMMLLGAMLLLPLSAALMVPPSVVMVMAAQVLGAGALGADHPVALALALCLGWATAIAGSPLSAMTQLAARLLRVSPARLAFRVNRGFSLFCLGVGAVMVSLTYAFG